MRLLMVKREAAPRTLAVRKRQPEQKQRGQDAERDPRRQGGRGFCVDIDNGHRVIAKLRSKLRLDD